MEILTFLVCLAVLVVLIINTAGLNQKISNLVFEVNYLRSLIQKIEKAGMKPFLEEKPTEQPKTEEKIAKKTEDSIPLKNSDVELSATPRPLEPFVTPKKEPEGLHINEPFKTSRPSAQPEQLKKEYDQFKPKTAKDFEKFVGENIISKIGIVLLVLGLGFFVKYAIDKDWINEYGRTAIGLLAGGLLLGIAHSMRKSYKTFSSLLTGGGFATMYFTITIAFHQYHLFSQVAAFAILVVITIFSVILSLVYDKKELAIFSQVGGYAAPFMVSTGAGNYAVLFSYLLILNAGLIALVYFKRWHLLNLLAFIFTVIIYSSWLGSAFWDNPNPPSLGAFIFASLFYLVFFLVNVLNNLKEQKPFNSIEIGMILSNNLLYFLSGLAILHHFHEGVYKGLFTVLIGLYNFGWAVYLYRKQQVDKNLIFLLVGLVMSYISIAIPIQLNGHSITIFWTAEFVILLWLSQKSGIKILKAGHLIILALALVSLVMDWGHFYSSNMNLPILVNSAFITGAIVLAGLCIAWYLLKQEREEVFMVHLISTKGYQILLISIMFILAYLVPFLELQNQTVNYFQALPFRQVVYGIYNFAFLFILLAAAHKLNFMQIFKVAFNIAIAGLAGYLIFYHIIVLELRDLYYVDGSVTLNIFLFHYLVYPFIIGVIAYLFKERSTSFLSNSIQSKVFLWFLAFFVIYMLSAELDNIALIASGSNADTMGSIVKTVHKAGYPILWGIGAFLLIWWGLRVKEKVYFRIALIIIFGMLR